MEGVICNELEKKVQYYVPGNEVLGNLANFFSVFSDVTRIKMLSALSISDLCVGDIAKILNLNQTTVSHQLKLLKSAGVVNTKRDGKSIYYSINNEYINDVLMCGVNYLGY